MKAYGRLTVGAILISVALIVVMGWAALIFLALVAGVLLCVAGLLELME